MVCFNLWFKSEMYYFPFQEDFRSLRDIYKFEEPLSTSKKVILRSICDQKTVCDTSR